MFANADEMKKDTSNHWTGPISCFEKEHCGGGSDRKSGACSNASAARTSDKLKRKHDRSGVPSGEDAREHQAQTVPVNIITKYTTRHDEPFWLFATRLSMLV